MNDDNWLKEFEEGKQACIDHYAAVRAGTRKLEDVPPNPYPKPSHIFASECGPWHNWNHGWNVGFYDYSNEGAQ